jgi:hypothetical protein
MQPLLPGILSMLRLIWNLSSHYNTPERIHGLLRRCCNAIINASTAAVSLSDALQGNVEGVLNTLQAS